MNSDKTGTNGSQIEERPAKDAGKEFNDFGDKAVESAFWIFSLRAIQVGCELLRLIILARLLSPQDFGVFGIALLSLGILEIFSEPSLKPALIQKQDSAADYLNTTWTFGIIRGAVVTLLLLLAAPLISEAFGAPEALPVIRAVAVLSLLRALTNASVIFFEKELRFEKFFKYQFLGFMVDIFCAIIVAVIWRSVWALVIGLTAGTLVRVAMSYSVDEFRPRFEFDSRKFKELWNFGKWILASNILLFLVTQGDDLVVGSLLGAASLGFYQLAFKISNVPQGEVAHLISRIAYPIYSKLQNDQQKLSHAYSRFLQLTIVVCIPLSAMICLFAADFTELFLGKKWLPIVLPLQILSVYGALRAVESGSGALFVAVGQPALRAKLQFSQLLILAAAVYPLSARFGIAGAAIAVTLYTLLVNPVAVYLALQISGTAKSKIFCTFLLSVIVSLAAAAITVAIKEAFFPANSLFAFIFLSVLSVCFIAAALLLFAKNLDYSWIFSTKRHAMLITQALKNNSKNDAVSVVSQHEAGN